MYKLVEHEKAENKKESAQPGCLDNVIEVTKSLQLH